MAAPKGITQKHHTPEERLEVATAICELYGTDQYTIESCCENEGIAVRTFTDWVNEVAEVAELYKKAKGEAQDAKRGRLKNKALTALERHLDVTESEEIINDGRTVTTKTKKVLPNITAVIFTLKNTDPDNWKEKQDIDVNQKVYEVGFDQE